LQAVLDDQGKQVGAEYSENAADSGADETLEADAMQPPFEDDDGGTEQRADNGIEACVRPKGANQVTSNRNKANEDKKALLDSLKEKHYQTKTKRERIQPVSHCLAEGKYLIVEHQGQHPFLLPNY